MKSKIKYVIPNIFTFSSLTLGILALQLASKQEVSAYIHSGWLIIIAIIFDGLDGKTARLLNAVSKFGKEIDSISDFAVFGISVAFLAYNSVLYKLELLGIILTFIYLFCGLFRLARFNSNLDKVSKTKYFSGLPIPGAAMMLAASIIIYNNENTSFFNVNFFAVLILLTSILMVSKIKYIALNKVKKMSPLIIITLLILFIISLVLSIIFSMKILLLWGPIYLLSGLIAHIIKNFQIHEENTKMKL